MTYEELFFDLVYVFAVTQVSHGLLHHLTGLGAVQALVLWFAVWLGWQYTCWATNWFDPETPAIRAVLFGTMALGLVMAAAIPQAFGPRGLLFAGAYVAMQVGRTGFIVWRLGPSHPLSANYRRMLGWLLIASVFWLAGGVASGPARLALWLLAAACEYGAPMIGFALPGLGRSVTRDWTIEGGHLAERCQLFVIVALGEAVLMSGATLADRPEWDAPTLVAVAVTFLGSLALWFLYFGTSSKDGTRAITRSPDPGRLGAYFHYVHACLVAGIIVTAVGTELAITHPDARVDLPAAAALLGGPALYLAGSMVYKRIVYTVWPLSHAVGLIALAILAWAGFLTDRLMLAGLSVLVLIAVAAWELVWCRREVARAG